MSSLRAVPYSTVVAMIYVTAAFTAAALGSVSSTARRMGAVAAGSGCLALAVLVAGLAAVFPSLSSPLQTLGGLLGLAAGLTYYLGFATPDWLRRSWREPELTALVEAADELAGQPDLPGLIRELQSAVSAALGLRGVFVGIWNERDDVLEYATTSSAAAQLQALAPHLPIEGGLLRAPNDVLMGGRCFSSQQPLYSENVGALDPDHAALYRALGVKAVIAAPMTIGDERYGVLGVYTPRPRLFGEDSLSRVQLMARYAAILLRSRRLLESAAAVKALEDSARLKDEFLSAATHDLKTPLTAIKGISQWIRRRVAGNKPIDGATLDQDLLRIETAAERMTSLVNELLDISRLRMDRPLELTPGTVDLVGLARHVSDHYQETTSRHEIRMEASGDGLEGRWDGNRLERVIDNLVGNAVKFSPQGGEVVVSLRTEAADGGSWAVLTVLDHGIGIPDGESERVFDRFERGANAAQRGITGTGIGLAYVREVIDAHGGRVAVESAENIGSTFTVWLPLNSSAPIDNPNRREVGIERK